MIELIAAVLPYKVLGSHILLAILFLALMARNGWGKGIANIAGRYAVPLGFFVSLGAVIGSLFYSEVVGFEPCVLCWWQRVFLFPLSIIFGLAWWKRDKSAFLYAVPLALLAGIIGLYQSYANLGGASLLPCTAAEGACSKLYVLAFGYITIPLMSLTISLYILILAWANNLYKRNENRNA